MHVVFAVVWGKNRVEESRRATSEVKCGRCAEKLAAVAGGGEDSKPVVITEQASIRNVLADVASQGALPELSELPDTWLVRIVESLELKPNVFGIGVNLNHLLIDFLKRVLRSKA